MNPDTLLLPGATSAVQRTEEPWRVLLASECSRYLSKATWRDCSHERQRIKDALHAQASADLETGGREAGVLRVISIREIGLAAASGILTVETEWLRRIARMVGQEDTREAAMATTCTVLRMGKEGLLQNIRTSTHLLYGSMFCDPVEPVRAIVEAQSRSVNVILGTLGWLGPLMRYGSWLLWIAGLLALIGFFCTDPGILEEPLFWGSMVAMALPVTHWYFYSFTDYLAFSLYCCFLRPLFWLAGAFGRICREGVRLAADACLWLWQFIEHLGSLGGALLRWFCKVLPLLILREVKQVLTSGIKGVVSVKRKAVDGCLRFSLNLIRGLLSIQAGLKSCLLGREQIDEGNITAGGDGRNGGHKGSGKPGTGGDNKPVPSGTSNPVTGGKYRSVSEGDDGTVNWAEVWDALSSLVEIPIYLVCIPFVLLWRMAVKGAIALAKAIVALSMLMVNGFKGVCKLIVCTGKFVVETTRSIARGWRTILGVAFGIFFISMIAKVYKNTVLPWMEAQAANAAREAEYLKVKEMVGQIESIKDEQALVHDLAASINAKTDEMQLTATGPASPQPSSVHHSIRALGKSGLTEKLRSARSRVDQKKSQLVVAKNALDHLASWPGSGDDTRKEDMQAKLATCQEIVSECDARVDDAEKVLGQLASLGTVASQAVQLLEDYEDLQEKLKRADADLPTLSRQRYVLVKRAQGLFAVPDALQFCTQVIEDWEKQMDKSAQDLDAVLKEAVRVQEEVRAKEEVRLQAEAHAKALAEEEAQRQPPVAMQSAVEARPSTKGGPEGTGEAAAKPSVLPDMAKHATESAASRPDSQPPSAPASTPVSPPDPDMKRLNERLSILGQRLKQTDEQVSLIEQEYSVATEGSLERAFHVLKNYDFYVRKLDDHSKTWVLESQKTEDMKAGPQREASSVAYPVTEKKMAALQSKLHHIREEISQGTTKVDKAQQKLRSALAHAGETISREVADLERQIEEERGKVDMMLKRLRTFTDERAAVESKLDTLSTQVAGNKDDPEWWAKNLAKVDEDDISIKESLTRLQSESAVTDADAGNRLQAILERYNTLVQKLELISDYTTSALRDVEPRHAQHLQRAQVLGDEVNKLRARLEEGIKGWLEQSVALERTQGEFTQVSNPIARELLKELVSKALWLGFALFLLFIIVLPAHGRWKRKHIDKIMESIQQKEGEEQRNKALKVLQEETFTPVLAAIGRHLDRMSLKTESDYQYVLDHQKKYQGVTAIDLWKAALLSKIAANIKERIQHTVPVG